jgi:hypothetical protein
MPLAFDSLFHSSYWEVLVLFLVPIGGGIPAGVLLAKRRALTWPIMAALYFISDVILACVYEPLMLAFLKASDRSPKFSKIRASLAENMKKTTDRISVSPGPFSLVMITFGTDPMTGRAAAKALGHGFLSGWAIAIAGDMVFFFVLMGSTLWLNSILGDGTVTAVLVMAFMLFLPPFFRKIKERIQKRAG